MLHVKDGKPKNTIAPMRPILAKLAKNMHGKFPLSELTADYCGFVDFA